MLTPLSLHALFGADENVFQAVDHPRFHQVPALGVDLNRHIGRAQLELPDVDDVLRGISASAPKAASYFHQMRLPAPRVLRRKPGRPDCPLDTARGWGTLLALCSSIIPVNWSWTDLHHIKAAIIGQRFSQNRAEGLLLLRRRHGSLCTEDGVHKILMDFRDVPL